MRVRALAGYANLDAGQVDDVDIDLPVWAAGLAARLIVVVGESVPDTAPLPVITEEEPPAPAAAEDSHLPAWPTE